MLQEVHQYSLDLLAHHQLAEEQIAGELANEQTIAAMVAKDPGFVD